MNQVRELNNLITTIAEKVVEKKINEKYLMSRMAVIVDQFDEENNTASIIIPTDLTTGTNYKYPNRTGKTKLMSTVWDGKSIKTYGDKVYLIYQANNISQGWLESATPISYSRVGNKTVGSTTLPIWLNEGYPLPISKLQLNNVSGWGQDSPILVTNNTSGTSTYVTVERTDTNYAVQFGIGSGGANRGIYDIGTSGTNTWMIYMDANDKVLIPHDIFVSGNLRLTNSGTTTDDVGTVLYFTNNDSTTGGGYSDSYISVHNDHASSSAGNNMIIKTGGNMFFGSGESPINLYNSIGKGSNAENLYITADNVAYIYGGSQTVANRVGVAINTSGHVLPYKAEAVNDNAQNLGSSTDRWANIYSANLYSDYIDNVNTTLVTATQGTQVINGFYTGTNGTAGYVKLCTINVVGTYANEPIEIGIARRNDYMQTRLYVHFTSQNNTDPTLRGFRYVGQDSIRAYIYKSATSTWDIYIQKTEAYDGISVTSMHIPYYMRSKVTLTWVGNKLVTTVPSGATQASLTGTIYRAQMAVGDNDGNDIRTTYLKLSGGTMTGTISFEDGDACPAFSSSPTYLLGVESFANGGTIKYRSANSTTVGSANYPTGFSARQTGATWGNQDGTVVTRWDTSNGGAIAYRENGAQLNSVIDGFYYQNEGKYKVVDENSIGSLTAGSATNATNVGLTTTNPTSETTYYLPWANGSGNKALGINNGLQYLTLEGTTSTAGTARLKLGNGVASGTAGNKEGIIRMYSRDSTYYAQLAPATTMTANRTIRFPNAAGWVAVGGNGSSTGVGSSSQPVYLSTGGVLTAITGALGNDITGNATTATTATNVTVTLDNPTDSTFRYLTFASGNNGNLGLYASNAGIHVRKGTTSQDGWEILQLGTGIASGTAGNKQGRIRLYGNSTGYMELRADNITTSKYSYFPNHSGTVALEPVSLYSNNTGTTGTVTLSETSANFTYLDIYYYTSHGSGTTPKRTGYTRVYNPNGTMVALTNTVYWSNQLLISQSQVSISGTSITRLTNEQSQWTLSSGKSPTRSATTTNLYIYRVDGIR